MTYKLFTTETFEADLKKLDTSIKKHIKKVIQKIISNPQRLKPLKCHSNVFRLRFKNYRLIYKVEQKKIILLFVRKRSKIYENLYYQDHKMR